MQDYFTKYLTDKGFDLPRLINDDYMQAIKLVWNNRLYISTAKLIVSMLDTLAFLEYGDAPRNFQTWLETYMDLSKLNVTADELWEFRNSLLHMTNVHSRKVASGKVRRLVLYIGHLEDGDPKEDSEAKYLGLYQLIQELAPTIQRFCESFNADPTKFEAFVERYDLILSDSRYLYLDREQLRSLATQ